MYLKTLNATRHYNNNFRFQAIRVMGTWHGIAEVKDADFAKQLIKDNPQVTEIKKEEYEALKKTAVGPAVTYNIPAESSPKDQKSKGAQSVKKPQPSKKDSKDLLKVG